MKEYSMSQKGLDAIDRIIKESPQYIELIEEFITTLSKYPHERREYERARYIRYHETKWRERYDDITRTKE